MHDWTKFVKYKRKMLPCFFKNILQTKHGLGYASYRYWPGSKGDAHALITDARSGMQMQPTDCSYLLLLD
jgi:hypothetical protein